MFFSKPAKNGGGGSTPVTSLTGTPTEIVYIDNAGVGTSDALATRDSVTNETYIGYRTSGGDFSNAFHLGNILGGALSDGAAFQRHDAVNDNFTFIGTVDSTPFGGNTNALLGGYADLVNGIFASTSYDDIGANVNYNNSVLGVSGAVTVNDSNTEISHQASSHTNSIRVQDFIDLRVDNTLGRNILRLNGDYIRGNRGSHSGAYFELNTANDTFDVGGRPSSLMFNTRLLHIDTLNATTAMGDVDGNLTNVKFATDLNAGLAYVDGLKTEVVNWTPSTLSDGFTGTGLNDMNYDSTVTYTGTYPNTYTAGIASVGSVHITLTSITTPGFTVGDTVTDGASTGTIIAGSDGDGFIIIQPIIDSGWTSATSITDISSGAASSVGGLYYTDTMSWSSTGGGSGIIIPTSSVINLGDGLTVGFGSQTGHTLGDLWEWTMLQGTVYSKMALFDGANRTMSIGDIDKVDVRTDWVLGTGKDTGIYNYIAKAEDFIVYNDEGGLMVLNYRVDNNFELIFGIYNPHNGMSTINSLSDKNAYGIGINISDVAGDHYVLIGDFSSGGNSTYLMVDDDAETITLNAAHISSPLAAYDDDADAGSNGVIAGELYQTTGSGASPLNVAGIVMIKQ